MGLAWLPLPTVFHPILSRGTFLDLARNQCRAWGALFPPREVVSDIDLSSWHYGGDASDPSALSVPIPTAVLP